MATQVSSSSGLYSIYWLFAVVYTFMKWGFWWGILNMFVPFAPMVDLVKYLAK
jgi:hypothetical protein